MKSIWEEYQTKEFPKLKEDIKTEVFVIGGGLSGILCAHFLQESGKKVILVEMDKICSKKSKKTTAVITALQDMMYHEYPIKTARLFLNANLTALEEYKKLSKLKTHGADHHAFLLFACFRQTMHMGGSQYPEPLRTSF